MIESRKELVGIGRSYFWRLIEPRSHKRNVAFKAAYLMSYCDANKLSLSEDLCIMPRDLACCVVLGLKNAIANNRRINPKNLSMIDYLVVCLKTILSEVHGAEQESGLPLTTEGLANALYAAFHGLDVEISHHYGELYWG